MTEHIKRPEILDEDALINVIGGAEYLAPGVYVEEVSYRARKSPEPSTSTKNRR